MGRPLTHRTTVRRRRAGWLGWCAALVLVGLPQSSPAGPLDGLLGRPQTPPPAVVRVTVVEKDGLAAGTGSLVHIHERYGLVITNWHVVRNATGRVSVQFPDGFRSAAQILRTDPKWDLAALAVWRPRVEPLKLAGWHPVPGEQLTIAGYGAGSFRSASGRCIQFVAPDEKAPYEMIEVAVTARDGDSGGPILNAQGELAGVLFGSARGATSGSHIVAVRRFLDPLLPLLAAPGQPLPSALDPAPAGGLSVHELAVGSSAEPDVTAEANRSPAAATAQRPLPAVPLAGLVDVPLPREAPRSSQVPVRPLTTPLNADDPRDGADPPVADNGAADTRRPFPARNSSDSPLAAGQPEIAEPTAEAPPTTVATDDEPHQENGLAATRPPQLPQPIPEWHGDPAPPSHVATPVDETPSSMPLQDWIGRTPFDQLKSALAVAGALALLALMIRRR